MLLPNSKLRKNSSSSNSINTNLRWIPNTFFTYSSGLQTPRQFFTSIDSRVNREFITLPSLSLMPFQHYSSLFGHLLKTIKSILALWKLIALHLPNTTHHHNINATAFLHTKTATISMNTWHCFPPYSLTWLGLNTSSVTTCSSATATFCRPCVPYTSLPSGADSAPRSVGQPIQRSCAFSEINKTTFKIDILCPDSAWAFLYRASYYATFLKKIVIKKEND